MSTIEEQCRSVLEAATADVRKLTPGIELRTSTVRAQTASALIAASRDADTVVVGSRGLGALKESLVGSTSMQLAAYASCPVVVVRRDTQLAESALRAQNLAPYTLDVLMAPDDVRRRLLLGRFATRDEAEAARAKLGPLSDNARVIIGWSERFRVPVPY